MRRRSFYLLAGLVQVNALFGALLCPASSAMRIRIVNSAIDASHFVSICAPAIGIDCGNENLTAASKSVSGFKHVSFNHASSWVLFITSRGFRGSVSIAPPTGTSDSSDLTIVFDPSKGGGQESVYLVLEDTTEGSFCHESAPAADAAELTFRGLSTLPDDVTLWYASANCFDCMKQPFNKSVASMWMQSKFEIEYEFRCGSKTCGAGSFRLYELGKYAAYVSAMENASSYSLLVSENAKPVDSNFPIWVAALIYAALGALWYCVRWKISRRAAKSDDHRLEEPLMQADEKKSDATTTKPKTSGRVQSLDTFRGAALTVMIFVNYGGGGYWFFAHSKWSGLTVADLVFPWFMWIMGTSMALSVASKIKRGVPKFTIWKQIAIRSIKLFALGCFMNGGAHLAHWRLIGVLQYFAVAGFFVGSIVVWVPSRKVDSSSPWRDILPFWPQWLCAFLLLILYLIFQYATPLPKGCPRGYTGPGGIGDQGKYPQCTGGAHKVIDDAIWGERHIYHHDFHGDIDASLKWYYDQGVLPLPESGAPISSATCADTYGCAVYDPEGTLGMLTASFMTFLGLQAGRLLKTYSEHGERLKRWVIWGLATCAVATALCGGTKFHGIMPLNKNLWSPSFILAQSGTGNLLLALCYYIIDVKKWWSGGPFKFVGKNSILIYVGHELLSDKFPFTCLDSFACPTHSAMLFSNLLGVTCWCMIAYYLYSINFFVSV